MPIDIVRTPRPINAELKKWGFTHITGLPSETSSGQVKRIQAQTKHQGKWSGNQTGEFSLVTMGYEVWGGGLSSMTTPEGVEIRLIDTDFLTELCPNGSGDFSYFTQNDKSQFYYYLTRSADPYFDFNGKYSPFPVPTTSPPPPKKWL